ncbi:MAG: glucose-6-phosphate 1-dehydrogenase [Patescibacteria group bacterium]|nr:MAG: glucose-6-phosphate 1-dehydrogenase [Patescibacteria group bacterium]
MSSDRMIKNPFILTIFGATGDLSRKKIFPALFALFKKNLLSEEFHIFAVGRRASSESEFRELIIKYVENDDHATLEKFLSRISYVCGDLETGTVYQELYRRIHETEQRLSGECLSKLYYMALTPGLLPKAVEQMGQAGLHLGCGEEGKWSRIIVEKPFGKDLESAKALNEVLRKYFIEEQIYRIDHYLGKELVQTILSVRFANAMFYPLLNKEYIERIEILAAEEIGIEDRGVFYDQTGALRDFVQSHLLQIIALVTMDEPRSFEADILRDAKSEALKALRFFDSETICTDIVHAQYEGYRQEVHVHPDSLTETYVAFKTYMDLPAWRDVPIYVQHGKKMANRETAVHFVFKPHCGMLYCDRPRELRQDVRENVLSILLSPREGFRLQANVKRVGFGTGLRSVDLNYSYSETDDNIPDAYERLLMDAMNGDQSLFIRSDEIEASWQWIDKIMALWETHKPELYFYSQGTNPALLH